LQKLRHTFLATGTTSRPASWRVPGLVAGWLRQVTLTAHTRWPLPTILKKVASDSNMV